MPVGINRTANVPVGICGIDERGLVGVRVTCGDHPIHVGIGSLQGSLPSKPNEASARYRQRSLFKGQHTNILWPLIDIIVIIINIKKIDPMIKGQHTNIFSMNGKIWDNAFRHVFIMMSADESA